MQQGEESREVSATDLQHCDWCGAGSLTMLKCGKCRLVYYCSIDCQKAARSKHIVVCVPSPGAAHRGLGVGRAAGCGGEARDGRSLLGDLRGMCMSAGNFFATVGGQYQQALSMFEFTLVCALALEGHDSPLIGDFEAHGVESVSYL